MFTALKRRLPEPQRRRLRRLYDALRELNWCLRCPVCERPVKRFGPLPSYHYEQMQRYGFDYKTRRVETCNAAAYGCPRCGASDRDRLYALYLKTRLPADDARFSLLDIAPSPPLSAFVRRKFQISYKTADLLMEGIDDHVDITRMDIYPAASFDAFICSHVLEHVQDDIQAMAELRRILKPGGWGIAMVPIELGLTGVLEDPAKNTEAERWKHFAQGDHVRMYSREGFVGRLERVGFTVQVLSCADEAERKEYTRVGIDPCSVLYVAWKGQVRYTGSVLADTLRQTLASDKP
jgi:SAM-dependent methyltransferase